MIIELTPDTTNATEADLVSRYRDEIDEYFAQMAVFNTWPIYEVLQALSAMSARASEIRTQIMRRDSRRLTAFRTKELDPLIEELDRQFKIHSRIQAIREMEFKMSGGAF